MSLVWQQWAFLGFAVLEVLCTVGHGRQAERAGKETECRRAPALPSSAHTLQGRAAAIVKGKDANTK